MSHISCNRCSLWAKTKAVRHISSWLKWDISPNQKKDHKMLFFFQFSTRIVFHRKGKDTDVYHRCLGWPRCSTLTQRHSDGSTKEFLSNCSPLLMLQADYKLTEEVLRKRRDKPPDEYRKICFKCEDHCLPSSTQQPTGGLLRPPSAACCCSTGSIVLRVPSCKPCDRDS